MSYNNNYRMMRAVEQRDRIQVYEVEDRGRTFHVAAVSANQAGALVGKRIRSKPWTAIPNGILTGRIGDGPTRLAWCECPVDEPPFREGMDAAEILSYARNGHYCERTAKIYGLNTTRDPICGCTDSTGCEICLAEPPDCACCRVCSQDFYPTRDGQNLCPTCERDDYIADEEEQRARNTDTPTADPAEPSPCECRDTRWCELHMPATDPEIDFCPACMMYPGDTDCCWLCAPEVPDPIGPRIYLAGGLYAYASWRDACVTADHGAKGMPSGWIAVRAWYLPRAKEQAPWPWSHALTTADAVYAWMGSELEYDELQTLATEVGCAAACGVPVILASDCTDPDCVHPHRYWWNLARFPGTTTMTARDPLIGLRDAVRPMVRRFPSEPAR